MTHYAYVWSSGEIGFGSSVPRGAIKVTSGDQHIMPALIASKSVLKPQGYSDGYFAVPDIGREGNDKSDDIDLWIEENVDEWRAAGLTLNGGTER